MADLKFGHYIRSKDQRSAKGAQSGHPGQMRLWQDAVRLRTLGAAALRPYEWD